MEQSDFSAPGEENLDTRSMALRQRFMMKLNAVRTIEENEIHAAAVRLQKAYEKKRIKDPKFSELLTDRSKNLHTEAFRGVTEELSETYFEQALSTIQTIGLELRGHDESTQAFGILRLLSGDTIDAVLPKVFGNDIHFDDQSLKDDLEESLHNQRLYEIVELSTDRELDTAVILSQAPTVIPRDARIVMKILYGANVPGSKFKKYTANAPAMAFGQKFKYAYFGSSKGKRFVIPPKNSPLQKYARPPADNRKGTPVVEVTLQFHLFTALANDIFTAIEACNFNFSDTPATDPDEIPHRSSITRRDLLTLLGVGVSATALVGTGYFWHSAQQEEEKRIQREKEAEEEEQKRKEKEALIKNGRLDIDALLRALAPGKNYEAFSSEKYDDYETVKEQRDYLSASYFPSGVPKKNPMGAAIKDTKEMYSSPGEGTFNEVSVSYEHRIAFVHVGDTYYVIDFQNDPPEIKKYPIEEIELSKGIVRFSNIDFLLAIGDNQRLRSLLSAKADLPPDHELDPVLRIYNQHYPKSFPYSWRLFMETIVVKNKWHQQLIDDSEKLWEKMRSEINKKTSPI